MDKTRKRSVVWSFFKDIDDCSVQCLLCCRYLRRKEDGSTTPMLRHLRLKHPTQLPGKHLGQETQSASSQINHSMELDGDQIISVVVEMEDGDSEAKTPLNDSDLADGGVFETSQDGPAEPVTYPKTSDDCHVKNTRRRSLIWRFFEHLDSLNAARCRICKKKLLESGGISNLRRHMMKRHPKVLSELLASNQRRSAMSSRHSVVSHEAFLGTEKQDPVKVVFVEDASEILTKLSETEGPVINGLVDSLEEDSAQMTTRAEASDLLQRPPEADGGTVEASWDDNQKWISVNVELQDVTSDGKTPSNEANTGPALNGQLDTSTQQTTQDDGSEGRSVRQTRRRSLIWQHFERLESLEAARCRICMKKLQCFESGCTSNLHRHMSKRHPKVFSQLVSNRQQNQPQNSHTDRTNEDSVNLQEEIPGTKGSAKVSRASEKVSIESEGESRVFRRERELIEALRRTQREEARTLEHQRELVEKLRAASSREAAAERQKIELLRKAQKEQAKELKKQREELEREKLELQEKWEELHQEKVGLLLLSREKEAA